MLEVVKVDLPGGKTVGSQLHESAIDLLPEDMAEDSLVIWITKYDSLNRELPQDEDPSESFEREWHRGDGQTWVVRHYAKSTLQAKLPFYFAALFHLGRMQQVSQAVLQTVSAKQQDRVLKPWSSSLAKLMTGRSKEERATGILQKLFTASETYNSKQHDKVREWWSLWRTEVRMLQESVVSLERDWSNRDFGDERRGIPRAFLRLSALTNIPSKLQTSMSSEGVRFKASHQKDSMDTDNMFGGQSWILPLLLASMDSDGPHSHDFGREFRYLLRDLQRDEHERRINEQERRIAPQVEIALNRLRIKYGEADPFNEFAVGRYAATLTLRELVKENRLPNGTASPWLHGWEETLEDMPSSWTPLAKPKIQEHSLHSALRLADSAIKEHVSETMRPTEAWIEFVQRIFEDNWIERVAEMAGKANKKTDKAEAVWSLDEFISFIEGVVIRLNKIGYSTRTPEKKRLEILLDKTSSGESIYGEDSW